MFQPPLSMVLEFARAEKSDDPFEFRFAPQAYLLRKAGGGYQQASFPWDAALLSDLAAVRDAGVDPEVLARLGELLHRFVTPLGWPQLATQIKQARDQGQRVLLTIRSAAAEVYTLPWELLTLGASGEHVGALPDVLLRYEWPETGTTPEKPLPRTGIGRILLAWSAAGGAVPAPEQIEAVTRACAAGFHPLDPTRDVLAHASLRRLGDTLAAAKREGRPISVLHILCHGSATRGTFGLVLDGDAESDAAVTIDAGRLRQVLAPHADMVRLVVLSACDSGNSGQVGNRLGSIAQALHRAGMAAVVASRYPLSVAGSIRFTQGVYTALLERLASLESAILEARADLAGDAEHRDWASLQLYAREADGPDTRPLQFRPYPGLAAFDRDQRRFYFGREDLTRKLWGRCQDLVGDAQATRLLAILAPSGFGKSSVARAGLLAEIELRPLKFTQTQDGVTFARVATLKPGTHPLKALQIVMPTDAAEPGAAPLVLLVDQFEEVYTLCTDAAERDKFVDRLLAVANTPECPTLVVLTLRTDFIGETGQKHPVLNRLFGAQAELVTAMSADDLRRSIAEPAVCLGRPLDDATIDLLLTQVRGQEGALPLLGFALSQIWEGMLAGRAPDDTLREIGGVGGALAGKARAIYGALSDREKATARRALVRLVRLGEGTRDTRRRMAVHALCGRGETEDMVLSVLRKLATEQARLVTLLSEGGETQVEVTHEALLEHWTVLRGWIDESRKDRVLHDRASDAAIRWNNSGRPSGSLWRTPDLEQLAEYQRRKPDELSPLLGEFLAASSQQQRRERLLRIGAVLSLFAAFSIVVGIYISDQRKVAAIERKRVEEAEKNERQATAAAEANRQRLLDTYVDRGRQLVFERGNLSEGLLWLHRAQVEKSWDTALPELLDSAIRTTGTPRAVLIGHASSVASASYSPDGRRVVTASHDRTARVWEADSGRLVGVLAGHLLGVASASYSPDGRRIVTASHDKTARVWEADSRRLVAVLTGHLLGVNSASYSPDGRRIVTASDDTTVRIWEADSGRLVAELKGHLNTVNSASYSPDGRRIVTASHDKTARIWEADSGRLVAVLTGHLKGVKSASYSPDGCRIVTASWDDTARVWEADSRQQVAVLQGDKDRVLSASYSSDGRRIVTASWDATARVWEAEEGQLVAVLQGYQDHVNSASYSPDGRRIVTAGDDHTARVWEADSGRLVAELMGHQDTVRSASYSPDGRRIVTASWDKTARVWEADSGRLVAELTGHLDELNSASYSPDGRRIVTASNDHTARLWEADSGRLVGVLTGHLWGVESASYSPDGCRIVTASLDNTPRMWEADGGRLVAELKGHLNTVNSASYSPDGRRIVTASNDTTVRIWEADSGRLVAVLTGHLLGVNSASYSPDGRRIVTASDDTTVRIWEADSGRLVAVLIGHLLGVKSASYSPDGRRIVTASWDKTARVWEADSGRLVAELKGRQADIWSASYSPDSRRIVTASIDNKTARVWEADSGRLVAELKGHHDEVVSALYSPDGRRIITASKDKTARVWDVSRGTRKPEQFDTFIRCHLSVQFDPRNGNIPIIPHTPTPQDCPDSAYSR